MRTTAIALAAAVTLLAPGAALPRAGSLEEAKATAPKLKLTRQTPATFELGNGIRVWHLENDRLPLVSVRAVIRTGAIWEPGRNPPSSTIPGKAISIASTRPGVKT